MVDEIINLGDFWFEEKLNKNKEIIIKASKEVSRCFQRAYGYLAQARLLNEEIESYYWDSKALNLKELNKIAVELISEIFNKPKKIKQISQERHLFGSAITPKGFVHYLDTIFGRLEKRYIITGNEGTGKATILEKIYKTALHQGQKVEVYHCALIPSKIEHLLLPDLSVGIITSTNIHYYEKKEQDIVIDTSDYVNFKALERLKSDIKEASIRYDSALNRGISYINRAKLAHDELENYYIPAMDFEKMNECRKHTIKRILSYI